MQRGHAALDAGDGSGDSDGVGDVCVATEDGSGTQCFDLLAGQHILAGSVCVRIEGDDLAVTYSTTDGWELTETHLWVGTTKDGYGGRRRPILASLCLWPISRRPPARR